jgi:hypothetical protein
MADHRRVPSIAAAGQGARGCASTLVTALALPLMLHFA